MRSGGQSSRTNHFHDNTTQKQKNNTTHIASNCLTTLVVDPHEIKVNIVFGFTVRSL